MLKKLFKYEFKSTAKIMLILYAILIITTSVGSVVLYSLDLDQAVKANWHPFYPSPRLSFISLPFLLSLS